MTGDVDMNNHKIENLPTPTDNTNPATKKYVDDAVAANKVDGSVFLKLDRTRKMTGNLDMNNNRIYNLPLPTGDNQPTQLVFTNRTYVHLDGTSRMGGNLNMNNKSVNNLRSPVTDTDVATKKYYVDDNAGGSPDLSDYLEKDGSVIMTGDLNVGNNKIKNLSNPTEDNEAVTKDYVDKLKRTPRLSLFNYNDETDLQDKSQ